MNLIWGKAKFLLLACLMSPLLLSEPIAAQTPVHLEYHSATDLDKYVPRKVSDEDELHLKAVLSFAEGAKKITDKELLIRTFDSSTGMVRVSVRLREGVKSHRDIDWSNMSSRAAYRTAVNEMQQRVINRLDPVDFDIIHRLNMVEAFSVYVTEKGLLDLLADDNVVSVIHDELVGRHLAQGIPQISGLGPRTLFDGSGMSIAIIDDGVDHNHPKLGGAPIDENTKIIGGYDFADDNENYFSTDPSDNHGTAVAGIAAGDLPEPDETLGDYIGGVAPGARLYALKVFSDGAPGASFADIDAALDWSLENQNADPDNPIMVVNMSLGGGRYTSECNDSRGGLTYVIVEQLNAAGITVLSSSGNNGFCDSIGSPSCLTNIISVGAVYDGALGTFSGCISLGSCWGNINPDNCGEGSGSFTQATDLDRVTAYSNTASFLDILAPAHNATTTDNVAPGGGNPDGDYLPSFGGTSAASPYAAGAVAVLQHAARESRGEYLTPDEVRMILVESGNPIDDTKNNGLSTPITKPRVNLEMALEMLEPEPPGVFFAPSEINIIAFRQEPSPSNRTVRLANPSEVPIDYNVTVEILNTFDEIEWVTVIEGSTVGTVGAESDVELILSFNTTPLPVDFYEAQMTVTGTWESEEEGIVEIESVVMPITIDVQTVPARMEVSIDSDLLELVQVQPFPDMDGTYVYTVTTQTLQGQVISGRVPVTISNDGDRPLEFRVYQRPSWIKIERPIRVGDGGSELVFDPQTWEITDVAPMEENEMGEEIPGSIEMFIHFEVGNLPPGIYRESFTLFSVDSSVRNNPAVIDIRLLVSPQVGWMAY
ncbi:MAG: S8 family serine peptidase [Candidatus Sumerlaeia bacterium]|nr:S8 family serine peptidase [Candidatus Sumerlaeia bacterium]